MSTISWTEHGTRRSAQWRSENGTPPPTEVVVVDDATTAKAAYRLAKAGTGLLWLGDFHNARQLLRALDRRLQRHSAPLRAGADAASQFHRHRAERSTRSTLLGSLVVLLEPDHSVQLRRAPDVRLACDHAYGIAAPDGAPTAVSLTELLGVLSAYQWHQRGVEVRALGSRVHPAYGVFSPVRDEYVDLVAEAPFPQEDAPPEVAFDIGTGTGVLAALLARRGVPRVVATDINPRAVACAIENMQRLGVTAQVEVAEADLWPQGSADLIVCNPPWLPARPTSALELGIYDPGSELLHRFLTGLTDHLTATGEAWLVLSDLAEHLDLRSRVELLDGIQAAGLRVAGRHDTAPRHPRSQDATDPLRVARGREVTSLWRLVRR